MENNQHILPYLSDQSSSFRPIYKHFPTSNLPNKPLTPTHTRSPPKFSPVLVYSPKSRLPHMRSYPFMSTHTHHHERVSAPIDPVNMSKYQYKIGSPKNNHVLISKGFHNVQTVKDIFDKFNPIKVRGNSPQRDLSNQTRLRNDNKISKLGQKIDELRN